MAKHLHEGSERGEMFKKKMSRKKKKGKREWDMCHMSERGEDVLEWERVGRSRERCRVD